MTTEIKKLTKTNLNKLFVNKLSSYEFFITCDYSNYKIVNCNFNEKEKLIKELFSEECSNYFNNTNENNIYICNLENKIILNISKEEYFKFYISIDKQEKLYKETIKSIEDVKCEIGIRNPEGKISDIKTCEGNKKIIIEFINKNLQKYEIIYFHAKQKSNYDVVIKLNDLEWMTILELINKGLITGKDKR